MVINVEKFIYSRISTNVEFVHYKVINGGHQWFGSPWSYPTAINSSELLIEFFMEYSLDELACLSSNGDFNDDGNIDVSDFFIILSRLIFPDQSNLYQNFCMDINLDNKLDIFDLIITIDIGLL